MLSEIIQRVFGNRLFRYFLLIAAILGVVWYDVVSNDAADQHPTMEGYFVKRSGCHMSAMNPYPKQIFKYFREIESKECSVPQLFRSVTLMGKNYLVLAMSKKEIVKSFGVKSITEVYCNSTLVKRRSDDQNSQSKSKIIRLSHETPLIEADDGPGIYRIGCFGGSNKLVYHDVHFFLPEAPPRNLTSTVIPNRLSVMILGIDSISHMHFIRMMPLTAAFIEQQSHVRFWGYNRVGVNSYPNLVPLLSGFSEAELELGCYREKKYFDACQFLWNHFKAAGYNTSFGEDNRAIGTFTYCKRGFKQEPTDFYLRPVMVEIDRHTSYDLDKLGLIHCSAGRKYADILHEFIYKLTPHLKQGPHFSFFWETQGVHDYFNYARLLDEHYLALLRHFHKQAILNDTLVVFMADHGLRFGAFRKSFQGMLEESQPFVIALYPRWMEAAYPMAISNLRYNARSLVTNFDLYATLKDLSDLKLLRKSTIQNRSTILEGLGPNIPRGISLFLPIPEQRNCVLAGIPTQFCLCRKLFQIPSTDKRSQRAALFVVENINMLIESYELCQRLHLAEVRAAYLLHDDSTQQQFEVKVQVQTSPGDGLFEGTTRFTGNSLALKGIITRSNVYGNQSYCIHNYQIEMYCYCL